MHCHYRSWYERPVRIATQQHTQSYALTWTWRFMWLGNYHLKRLICKFNALYNAPRARLLQVLAIILHKY
jgi:hypothetical protein